MATGIEQKKPIFPAFGWKGIPLVLFIFILGFWLGQRPATEEAQTTAAPPATDQASSTLWTCSMDPQVRQSEPGSCPLCGMDLIPLKADSLSPRQLRLSSSARRLAAIQVETAVRKHVARKLHLLGKVEYDEKRVGVISAWVDGRIERLFVDFTGVEVKKGDHIVSIYSPDLLAAQQELLAASNSFRTGSASLRTSARNRLFAARQKLRLKGLTQTQIQAVERNGAPSDKLTIYAPMSGIVLKKHVVQGSYVKEGAPIYSLVDLSRVWVKLDAYEEDLAWLRFGQEISLEAGAYPGQIFRGTIVFIDPVVNPKTRTVKVRLNLDNPDGLLKPDMFMKATVFSKAAEAGGALATDLEGKWISPMHPEIIKDGPGTCDICGMDLVPANSLGLGAKPGNSKRPPLVIPITAPLLTGDRAVVYVELEEGLYEGRQIVLGPKAGEYYVVRSGLQEGDRVVVNGAFKIDSELQLQGKTSMMYGGPTQEQPDGDHAGHPFPKGFTRSLDPLLDAYFLLRESLSQDDLEAAKQRAETLAKSLDSASPGDLEARDLHDWNHQRKVLAVAAAQIVDAADLDEARVGFETLSVKLILLVPRLGGSQNRPMYRFFCPMAFDNRGAYWLQEQDVLANPYFGAAMLGCGSQVPLSDAHLKGGK